MPPHIQSQSYKEFLRILAKVYARTHTERGGVGEEIHVRYTNKAEYDMNGTIFLSVLFDICVIQQHEYIQAEPHYKLTRHYQNVLKVTNICIDIDEQWHRWLCR